MTTLRMTIVLLLLLPAPAVWAQSCNTPENIAALVDLIVSNGQPSGYGLSLSDERNADRHYVSFIPADLPELHMVQETWTTQGERVHIDQWIIQFTVQGRYVVHKELAEEDSRLVGEKQLPTAGVEAVICKVFDAFLPLFPVHDEGQPRNRSSNRRITPQLPGAKSPNLLQAFAGGSIWKE